MSAKGYHFSLATPADNADLIRFARGQTMRGSLRLALRREPDYFAALTVEGRCPQVLICRDADGQLVATGHRSTKMLSVSGEWKKIGYLSGLRIAPDHQRGTVLARGYRALRELHERDGAEFYLTTVMESNRDALLTLSGGRADMPFYHDLGVFYCLAAAVRQRRKVAADGLELRRGSERDATLVVSFLQQHGARRQFFPRYELADFSTGGLLPSLPWKQIFLAFENRELRGVMAAWDQNSFRAWQVNSYAPWLKMLRPFYNAWVSISGGAALPAAGKNLPFFFLSLVCIQNDNTEIFSHLLDFLSAEMQKTHPLMVAGMHETDPLLPMLKQTPHWPMPSRLFAVTWDADAHPEPWRDPQRPVYLEPGAL